MKVTSLLIAGLSVVLAANVIFQEDFDEFNLNTWQHEITAGGGGNWEFEWYTNNRSNSYVKNGVLHLKPTLTADNVGEASLSNGFVMSLWGGAPADLCTSNAFYGCERTAGAGGNIFNPIQSARIRSVNSFSFRGGNLEVKAKLPRGDWIWPAVWLLPKLNAYGSWPASGEIDLIESRGNAGSYSAGGVNQFGSTLHWGPYPTADPYMKTHGVYTLPSGDLSEDFHIYGMTWTNDSIITYIDNPKNVVLKTVFDQSFWKRGQFPSGVDNPWAGRSNAAPFDQDFYLVLNVAVGGVNGYFPDGVGGKPWTDKSAHSVNDFWAAKNQWYPTWKGEDAALQVDWIKVSQ